MSGIKVTNERPARAIADIESVDGTVVDEDVDWEPDTTTGIPPGGDPGDILAWDGDSWEVLPVGADDEVLTAASGEILGLDWRTVTAGLGMPWFLVTDPAYGAVGDNTTDDRPAFDAMIAAFNAAGGGVMYAPHPSVAYRCTGALTAITAPGMLVGDGGGDPGATGTASNGTRINCTSATATFLTIPQHFDVLHLTLWNTATASAGYGLGGTSIAENTLEDVAVGGFWVNFKMDGGAWKMRGCFSRQSRKYGAQISYVAFPDGGDWFMDGCYFVDGANSSDAAIYMTSAGGGKIVNCKINSSPSAGFGTGIDVAIGTGSDTTILLISNTSIENIRVGDGIRVTTSGTGKFGSVIVHGCQVGLYSNNAGRAVKLTAASTGGQTVAGGLGNLVIDSCVFHTDGTARAAVELTKTDRTTLGDYQLSGFNARYTATLDTNTTDAGAATGTVTSVGMTVPAELSVAGSPITGSGTLAVTTATQSANAVWAGPTSGSAAQPTFRALVSADLPSGATGSTSAGDHEHMVDVFVGDGSTTSFELSDEPLDPESVVAFVAGAETAVTMSGSMNTTAAFGSAPGVLARVTVEYAAVST